MRIESAYVTVARWTADLAAQRRARLASLVRSDELMLRIAMQAQASGAPYDTWRRVFHWPNSGW